MHILSLLLSTGFFLKFAASLAISAAVAYAWAGLGFWYFRRAQPETEARLRGFLDHYFFSKIKSLSVEARADGFRRLGKMVPMFSITSSSVLSDLLFHPNTGLEWTIGLIIINATLFFAGWMLAISWYGLRCLRLLGFAEQLKNSAQLNDQNSKAKKWENAISPCLMLLGALCLWMALDFVMTPGAMMGNRPKNASPWVEPYQPKVWLVLGCVALTAGVIVRAVQIYSERVERMKSPLH